MGVLGLALERGHEVLVEELRQERRDGRRLDRARIRTDDATQHGALVGQLGFPVR